MGPLFYFRPLAPNHPLFSFLIPLLFAMIPEGRPCGRMCFLAEWPASGSRWGVCTPAGYLLVVLPCIWMIHLDSLLISLVLKGRTRTATFTDAPDMFAVQNCVAVGLFVYPLLKKAHKTYVSLRQNNRHTRIFGQNTWQVVLISHH